MNWKNWKTRGPWNCTTMATKPTMRLPYVPFSTTRPAARTYLSICRITSIDAAKTKSSANSIRKFQRKRRTMVRSRMRMGCVGPDQFRTSLLQIEKSAARSTRFPPHITMLPTTMLPPLIMSWPPDTMKMLATAGMKARM